MTTGPSQMTDFPAESGTLTDVKRHNGFTLVELMISITILVILMMVVTQVIGVVQRNWVRSNSRVSQFREARIAFDTITRNISQATLNTYWENEFDELGTDAANQKITLAKRYVRQSELHFVCGPASTAPIQNVLTGSDYPGHAVFFQAPLGVTSVVVASGTAANTQNMVNLLCGRGYFVEWGDDAPYRPPFLNDLDGVVPTRSRFRLMEYSPTAEMNQIYSAGRPPVGSNTLTYWTTGNTTEWLQDPVNGVVGRQVENNERIERRGFTRPIAENILALVISPQLESTRSTATIATSIAPNYVYDSRLPASLSPANNIGGAQKTQHLLPPLLKVTMVAMDQRAGELLSADEGLQGEVLAGVRSLFTNAENLEADLEGTPDEPGTLKTLLIDKKISYRVFTTTIALRGSRWSL